MIPHCSRQTPRESNMTHTPRTSGVRHTHLTDALPNERGVRRRRGARQRRVVARGGSSGGGPVGPAGHNKRTHDDTNGMSTHTDRTAHARNHRPPTPLYAGGMVLGSTQDYGTGERGTMIHGSKGGVRTLLSGGATGCAPAPAGRRPADVTPTARPQPITPQTRRRRARPVAARGHRRNPAAARRTVPAARACGVHRQ